MLKAIISLKYELDFQEAKFGLPSQNKLKIIDPTKSKFFKPKKRVQVNDWVQVLFQHLDEDS